MVSSCNSAWNLRLIFGSLDIVEDTEDVVMDDVGEDDRPNVEGISVVLFML